MSNFLMIVATIVLLVVFVGGIVVGNTYATGEYSFDKQFNLLLAVGVWIGGSIPAFILFGLSDISDKLSKIVEKFDKLSLSKQESEREESTDDRKNKDDTEK